MITLRKASDRGHADHGWLNTYHTFSFASYHDREHMGFRSLRVMNEDRVAAGKGFGTHAHADMEIVTYVLGGALEHKDSVGNGEVLHPGEFQRISAGTGITHSEFNPSPSQTSHFYQIWLLPRSEGISPSYEQKRFDDSDLRNSLRLVASPDGLDGSLSIHQDAKIYLSRLDNGKELDALLPTGRYAWLQVLRGSVMLNNQSLDTGDGAAIDNESVLRILALSQAEILLFDLS
jgi:redox-sensitive bicupin YhaK (pirin superfamily)